MPWQMPKESHPWRTWRGGAEKDKGEGLAKPVAAEKKKLTVKPLRVLLEEIVSSWEQVEVVTSAYGRDGSYRLVDLPQEKIAAWRCGLIRRNYETG